MRTTLAVQKAARRFFDEIAPGVGFDYTDHKAKPLVLAAFNLYNESWRMPGKRWDITGWMWPFSELVSNGPFAGDEPWTILLRRAVEIARAA